MLNQVQHDIKKEPGFRNCKIMSDKIVNPPGAEISWAGKLSNP
jgi:hypothetical protein